MKHPWRLHRQTQPRSNGQQRWDRAYQLLLHWTEENEPPSSTRVVPPTLLTQEEEHASSSLRPRFNTPSQASSEH
jgi:hypothetical protein